MSLKSKVSNGFQKFKQINRFFGIRSSLKGGVLVILGILNTRNGIGIGKLLQNVGFGFFTYFFLILSAMLTFNLMKDSKNQNLAKRSEKKVVWSLIGIFYGMSIILSIINVMIVFLNFWIFVFITLLGIIWIILGEKSVKNENFYLYQYFIKSLTFSLGLFYGALLNVIIIPLYVYFFILVAFFLQFAREITKSLILTEKEKNRSVFPIDNIVKTSKIIYFSQIIALTFFIIPILTPIINSYLYLYALIINFILIVISLILTLKQMKTQIISKKANLFLKIEILVFLIALVLSAV